MLYLIIDENYNHIYNDKSLKKIYEWIQKNKNNYIYLELWRIDLRTRSTIFLETFTKD